MLHHYDAYPRKPRIDCSPDGDPIQSIVLPESATTAGLAAVPGPGRRFGFSLPGEHPLVNKGAFTPQSSAAGLLTRSGNGEWLSLAGTSGPPNTPWSAAVLQWTFALVHFNG